MGPGDMSAAKIPDHRANLRLRVKTSARGRCSTASCFVHKKMIRLPVGAVSHQVEASNLPQLVRVIVGEVVVVMLGIMVDIVLNRADAIGTVADDGIGYEVPAQDFAE